MKDPVDEPARGKYRRSLIWQKKSKLCLALVTLIVANLVAVSCQDLEDEEVKSSELEEIAVSEQGIINGAVPVRGSLIDYGVVRVNVNGGFCTGTLLTNRHVLTAQHCVRNWNGGWGALIPNVSVILEGTVAADDQNIPSNQAFTPTTTGLNAGDYAIIELSNPMTIAGDSTDFFNPIYDRSDNTLVGETGFCIGYGNNSEASVATMTTGAGGRVLRTANLQYTSASGGELTRARVNNRVGAPGDSGSTCFFNGQLTGVQSTCYGAWFDFNGDTDLQGREWTTIHHCTDASPDSYRDWVNDNILADTTVEYSFVPSLENNAQAQASLTSTSQSTSIDVTAVQTLTDFSPRSGTIEVEVEQEPAYYMCSTEKTTAPLAGDASLEGICMSEGLIPAILLPLA